MPPQTSSLRREIVGKLIVALACLIGAMAGSSAAEGNELLHPQGTVEIQRAGAGVWTKAATNTVLQPGDIVRTGKGSRALVRLTSGSVIRLDERSMLRIEPKEAGFLLKMLRGAAYFFHRERPVRTEFDTPLVSGAIRGTEFHLAVAENGRTVLTMFDGVVELTNAAGVLSLTNVAQAIIDPNQPPRRTAVIEAANIIQWCLYYPAVLDLDELELGDAEQRDLMDSLAAYRAGDLVRAFSAYPAERGQPASVAERHYLAQLLTAMGQIPAADTLLAQPAPADQDSRFVTALRTLIDSVKGNAPAARDHPHTGSQLLAQSYAAQSRADLQEALELARLATMESPHFGFAWARLAELEFSFGRTAAAREAIYKALQLTPRNAQAHALRGFLLASESRTAPARAAFDDAIAIDSALGNAWLGRGLTRIRQGDPACGRDDLIVAAALEPNRALLRSYLGKAWSVSGDDFHAERELNLAKGIDPRDPTAWLYSALLNQQRNRVNEAVRDLEHSQSLNDNRQLYRSRLLIEQDRAARSANLANIYRDAGLSEAAEREASRAVAADYANYSAHLFLAESYNARRDPGLVNLRYETPVISELLIANMLAPAAAGAFSQYVSQQEYSRLFERDGPGLSSDTVWLSRGDWAETASHYANYGNVSYAIDIGYRSFNGEQPNGALEQLVLAGTLKLQLTPRDTLLLLPIYADVEGGDLRQYYNPAAANRTLRFRERQEPNLFAGLNHQWAPGLHTLLLAGLLQDELSVSDGRRLIYTVAKTNGVPSDLLLLSRSLFHTRQRSEFSAYSAELQQIWQTPRQSLIAGARYQAGEIETESASRNLVSSNYPREPQRVEADLERLSVYGHWHWRPWEPLTLIAGISYDRLEFPENIALPPVSGGQEEKDQVSPKFGAVWTPTKRTSVRGAYARSLGGLSYDSSVRLEPTQIAGFTSAYRSLIPESVAGQAAGTEFETWSAEIEQRIGSGNWLSVRGELLESQAGRTLGVFDSVAMNNQIVRVASGTPETLRFREKSLTFAANQLIGNEWAFGASYRVSEAELDERLPALVPITGLAVNENRAVLHHVTLFAGYNHPSGFFAQAFGHWRQQSNTGYTTELPGDEFWQFDLLAGWRFAKRRAEVTLGVLNITDEDYRLNPLNYHVSPPRERTLLARCRVNF